MFRFKEAAVANLLLRAAHKYDGDDDGDDDETMFDELIHGAASTVPS